MKKVPEIEKLPIIDGKFVDDDYDWADIEARNEIFDTFSDVPDLEYNDEDLIDY